MFRLLFLFSLMGFLSTPANAEIEPARSKYDKRMRTVAYNPQQVYRVKSYVGFVTMIMFDKDETYKAHAVGDPSAWEIAETGRFFFLKPKMEKASTNLFVLTNKRHYTFNLQAHSGRLFKANEVEHFSIAFTYPQEATKKQRKKAEKKQADYSLATAKNLRINMQYESCGDKTISPIAVYDNGLQTFMKFAPNAEIPAVYYVNIFGQESLLNYNVHNDWVSVHRVAKEFILRRGDFVACLTNRGSKKRWIRSDTGTVSGDVVREVKTNEDK